MLVGDYLFVSKVAYGPKLPNTPLAVPFTHNTLPFTQKTKAYSEAIQWPYKRIAGTTEIKRNDIIVFNFPAGDTLIVGSENPIIIARFVRMPGFFRPGSRIIPEQAEKLVREKMWERFEITTRPVDKRENYIKRGVGMPGDILELKDAQLYVNGKNVR